MDRICKFEFSILVFKLFNILECTPYVSPQIPGTHQYKYLLISNFLLLSPVLMDVIRYSFWGVLKLCNFLHILHSMEESKSKIICYDG